MQSNAELQNCTAALYQVYKLFPGIDLELNQDTSMFEKYRTSKNIGQSNVTFMTIKQF